MKKSTDTLRDFLGRGQPASLLGMMSGEEWNRRLLALPAPSLARHLARTIDAASLTSVPDEYTASPRSEAAKRRERNRREKQWRIEHSSYRVDIRGAPANARLYVISSIWKAKDGTLNHSMARMVATSDTSAKRRHHRDCRESDSIGKLISTICTEI